MKHIVFYMIKIFITPIFILLAFIGCHQKIEITAKNAITFLNDDKYMFLDVRTIDEYKNKAIPNAPCIPVQNLKSRLNELEIFRDKNIIVYCRSGARSSKATELLNNNGFNAINLIGGINKWNGLTVSSKD